MTNDEMTELYEKWSGAILFEGVWDGVPGLAEAMEKWAKQAWPAHYQACEQGDDGSNDAVFKAVLLEGTIRDEEGEEQIAKFFNQLPAPMQKAALKALQADPDSEAAGD